MHVISTAGHVDHGKSTLIERLTGIDPDRLAEEKRRGLTIDLGFAWLTLPSGREVGIVDVPGHERFIHNMLAGVGSVDATLFVVAANEGWRPQSEEHLAILDLLGARGGVVALTKSDLVDAPALEGARVEAARRLGGTTLAGAEIVPVSAATGDGIDDLITALERMLERTPGASDRGRPRLWIDRSFSIKGSGTVVTGTLGGGRIRIDDEVEIMPAGIRARVRGVQTHRRRLEEAEPGSRVALNLAGLERAEVARGDAAVAPGQWRPSVLVDVALRTTRSLRHPIGARGAYKVYVGSAEVDARLTLLDGSEVAPGGEALARLALGAPIVAEAFDRFVLRDSGRRETVAGGVVLDAHPAEPVLRSSARDRRLEELRARAAAGREDAPARALAERGVISREDLPWAAGTAEPPPGAVATRTWVLSDERFRALAGSLERALADFHAAEPLARGIPRDDLRAAAGIEDPRLFAELLDALAGRIAAEGPLVRLAAHAVRLSPEHEAARRALARELDAAGLSPPGLAQLAGRHGERLVRALVEAGDLVRVAPDIVFSSVQMERVRQTVADAIAREGPLTTSRLREVLGTSRKYAIPLLEYLDAAGVTKRAGDTRALAG